MMNKQTVVKSHHYDFDQNHVDILSVAILLPAKDRMEWLAEKISPSDLLDVLSNFIGMANSVQENAAEMLNMILLEHGIGHPDRTSNANLATLSGALRGITLSLGTNQKRTCKGCAYRKGTAANQSLVTTSDADYCIDSNTDFFCHEKVDANGNPVKLCAGHVQAKKKQFDDRVVELVGGAYESRTPSPSASPCVSHGARRSRTQANV